MFLNKLFGPKIVFGSSGGSSSGGSTSTRSTSKAVKKNSGGGKGSKLDASSKPATPRVDMPPKNKNVGATPIAQRSSPKATPIAKRNTPKLDASSKPDTPRVDMPPKNKNVAATPSAGPSRAPVTAPETLDANVSGVGGGGREGGSTAKRRASETKEHNLTIKRGSEGSERYKRRRAPNMAIGRS